MRVYVGYLLILLYLFSHVSSAGGIEKIDCKDDELLVTLIDYSYCTSKNSIKSLSVFGGKHTTLYIVDNDIEYSFAKMPTSIVVTDIPKKINISIHAFFDKLSDTAYDEDGYPNIRSAFDIKLGSIVSKYNRGNINAFSLINASSIGNSIYIFSDDDDDEYIYVVKGNIDESFSKKFLSGLQNAI